MRRRRVPLNRNVLLNIRLLVGSKKGLDDYSTLDVLFPSISHQPERLLDEEEWVGGLQVTQIVYEESGRR